MPLFVLNACQSAEEGAGDPYSSVASQLVAVGAKGVVAMSYSVYGGTAATFMGRFYESLVRRSSLSRAVAAARQGLLANPHRYSVVGPLELQNWIVPVLYQRERGYVPMPEEAGIAAPSEERDGPGEQGEAQVERQPAEETCPEGRFGFIGRDYDLLRLERALVDDRRPWALLTGLGGIGKTELAFGFARWFEETDGCPGGVFVTSFKEKADFGQVVGSIVGHGTDFSRLQERDQWNFLVGYLRGNASLLIWDNFETVAGYPQGTDALASDEEREKLSRFLKALRGGKSRVLITSRKSDEGGWLGIAAELVELGGLGARDAAVLASGILPTVGHRPEDFRDDPDYSELLRLLGGHPRSLEVVLPHLKTKRPRAIIDALQHRVSGLGEAMEDATLSYAFSQMSTRTRTHLPFFGLFTSRVHLGTLGLLIAGQDGQSDFYREVTGESLDAEAWEAVAAEAAGNGLCRDLGGGQYALHPTLPPFLRGQMVSRVGAQGLDRLESEFESFFARYASACLEQLRKGESSALTGMAFEEPNLLGGLRLAELGGRWRLLQRLAEALFEFYDMRGRASERASLRARLLGAVGRRLPDGTERSRGDLWMYLLGDEAKDALFRNDLEAAEGVHRQILSYLGSLNDPEAEPSVALAHHRLGLVAQERQRFDEAEQWYRKAMETYERLELEQHAADEYHQLGIVAHERQRLEEAEQWYRKALEIRERLGLERYAAGDYHQLGIVAQERQKFEEAEEWYRKALQICERLALEREAAEEYHQLGTVAQLRQRFNEAEQWYRKALEIFERLGLRPPTVNNLAQMGSLFRAKGDAEGAVHWFVRALDIAVSIQMRVASRIVGDLARTMKEMGEEEFALAWRRASENEPPLDTLRKILEQLDAGVGASKQPE